MESLAVKILKKVNFVRTQPYDYAVRLLNCEKYFDGKIFRYPGEAPSTTKEGFGAFYEAAHHLKLIKPATELEFNPYMNKVAEHGLTDIQRISNSANLSVNFDNYIEKYGYIVGAFNEGIELGSSTPEAIVAHLVTDDGNLDRGNRKHMLNPAFKLFGFASGPHEKFLRANVLTYCKSLYVHEDKNNEHTTKETTQRSYHKEIEATPKIRDYIVEDHEVITNDSKQVDHSVYRERKGVNDLSYSYYKSTSTTIAKHHEKLPEGIVSIDKTEKIYLDKGKKFKVTTTKKFKADGSVIAESSQTEI